MARFLYAWELGGNLGHIGTFTPVAQQLREAGHEVTFVVRETHACHLLLGRRFGWTQAPRFDGPAHGAAPISYADILAGSGYADPGTLMGLLVAWRTQFQQARPDLVFADHAPTAMLAARTLGIPVMLFGTGFSVPPSRSPWPAMRTWEPNDEGLLAARERQLLDVVNGVLALLDAAPLARLCALFDVAETGLRTLPELDQYQDRPAGRYWGLLAHAPLPAPGPDAPPPPSPAWPAGPGPRIYAYLRHEPALAAAILAAIRQSTGSSIVYYPDWTADVGHPPGMQILTQPADLGRLAHEADIAIANGASTIGTFLMAGKPVLSIACHLEHYLSGLRLAQLGAGLVLRADGPVDAIAPALQRLHSNGAFGEQARRFAARYAGLHQDAVVSAMCARALALAAA